MSGRVVKELHLLKSFLYDQMWKERRIAHGIRNRELTFYIIRRASDNVGLFSYVHTALGHIKYAREQGYIPIIDMEHYKSPYSDGKKENVWEYYFEQPIKDYDLKSIRHSRNIILSSGNPPSEYPTFNMIREKSVLEMWRKLHLKYIRINDETRQYIDGIKHRMWKEGKIVGVLCRGTDYTGLRPKGHQIQPDVETVIRLAWDTMRRFKASKIYLATEDVSILSKFQDEFGDKLLFPKNIVLPKWDRNRYICECINDRKRNHRLNGLEYLTQIALLAECDYFIGGGCGGTYEALLMSKGYEWQYVFDLGVY